MLFSFITESFLFLSVSLRSGYITIESPKATGKDPKTVRRKNHIHQEKK